MLASPIHRANLVLEPNPTEAAFLELRPVYLAIPERKLMRINLDITPMIMTALATAERVRELRADIARQLPEFDLVALDDLQKAAWGLDWAQGGFQARQRGSRDLQELAREATERRALLVQDLRNLAANGLVDASILKRLSDGVGFKRVVEDVRLCVALYGKVWTEVEGKTCTTRSDLDRSADVIHHMMPLIGDRDGGPVHSDEWQDMRVRAFTLLFRYHAQVRRAVTYVRFDHGDADSIAPSLFRFPHRGKRGQDVNGVGVRHPQPEQPAQPAPVAIGPNGPFFTGPAQAGAPCVGGQSQDAQPRLAGMPGGSPFLD